jgi:hypothetical protein
MSMFPPLPSYTAQSQEIINNVQQNGLDSITLGQLKAMVGSAPKPKACPPCSDHNSYVFTDEFLSQQSFYDFRYDDEDTVLNEIEEFYSYVEMSQVAENLKVWDGSYPGGEVRLSLRLAVSLMYMQEWIKSSPAQRKAHVEVLLESLEHRDAEIRFTNARRLLYILQGALYHASIRRCITVYNHIIPPQEPSQRLPRLNISFTGYSRIAK